MSLKELKAWNKNPLSKKASLNRNPILMAIRLNSKPRTRWGITEVKWALRKAVPYIKRAKKAKGKLLRKKGKRYILTKKAIALKNWGFDVKKRK